MEEKNTDRLTGRWMDERKKEEERREGREREGRRKDGGRKEGRQTGCLVTGLSWL